MIKNTAKYIIVGAGLSGLTSAYFLNKLGETDFLILESRDRVGGRILTKNEIDFGATWFQDYHENVADLLAQQQIVFSIDSQEQLIEITNKDNPKLILVDFFLEWCGPCEVMNPNYRTMFFGYDNGDDRMAIYQADSKILDGLEELNKEDPDVAHWWEGVGEHTCRPKFAVFFEGDLKGIVDGADYTKIFALVDAHIPTLEVD